MKYLTARVEDIDGDRTGCVCLQVVVDHSAVRRIRRLRLVLLEGRTVVAPLLHVDRIPA